MPSGDEALLAGVVDQVPLGIWIARVPGGEFVFANQVFREIMGTEARDDVALGEYGEPYGIHHRDGHLYPEEKMPFVRAVEARAIVTVDDIVIHRRDGRKVAIRATARPVFDGDTMTHVVIAFADITAEVEAEARRRDSEERLRHAQRLESLGTLASGVAHDFNNLLASIRILASLLRLRETDADRSDDLRKIEETTDSAAQLTRSLLSFGRQPSRRTVRLDLGRVVAGVVDLIRRTFDRQIEVVFAPPPGPAQVIGDPGELEQLVMNLVVNARDAMPQGGRLTLRVGLSTLVPGVTREVVLEVSDTGVGIPAEIRPRIFEPYFTTKQGRDSPGTGLGLATVYGIVQSHGGNIEVLDRRPQGTTFRVAMPAAPPEAAVAEPGPPRPGVTYGRGRVLLVDDEPLVRSSLRTALELLGYQVIEAADGVAAVEAVRCHAGQLAAVLLDAVMPRKSGREAFQEIHTLAPRLPVVLTTGKPRPEEHEELLALGVAGLLPKPFDIGALSETLARVLGPAQSRARASGDQ
jgi:signal transduction histidine kinase/ActR/RegA family two-component response regulator